MQATAHPKHSTPTDTPARLLLARGLCRDYATTRVLHEADVELATGDVLGVLGPNGAGKTTLLRMLAGTLAPSAGQVRIGDIDMSASPIAAKQQIGYLPERPPVYSELTVDEYLGFCARLHGIPRVARKAAITAAKADCELEDVGKRPIGHLSKGFQQRVGIAQAIVHRPAVLILDEPTAGLDPNQLRGVRELIARLARAHSVIISSHILPEIQAVATRVMIIRSGHVVLDSPMQALANEQAALDVGFRAGPGAQALRAFDGVRHVEHIGAGRWRLVANDAAALSGLRVALAEAAALNAWQLDLLMPRTTTLEDRFVQLTHVTSAPEQASS